MRGLSLSGRLSLEELEIEAPRAKDYRKKVEESTLLDFLDVVEEIIGRNQTNMFGEFLQTSIGGPGAFEEWNWGFNKPRFLKVFKYFKAWVNDETQAKVMAHRLISKYKITMEDLGYR